MGITGSLFTGVSGLASQSDAFSAISNNIANVSTVGYKGSVAAFSTLLAGSGSGGFNSGGVLARNRPLIEQQGLIQGTGNGTDIAISGGGFFTVNTSTDQTVNKGEFLYTRAGDFRRDSRGNLRNAGGFTLYGWPLDTEGRLPGQLGNLNTTSSQLLESLKPVNIKNINNIAAATTKVEHGFNLNASEGPYPGSGKTFQPPSGSALNYNVKAGDIIAPYYASGAALAPTTTNQFSNIQTGDTFSAVLGTGQTHTFTYAGFRYSNRISTGITFGAQTITSQSTPITGIAAGSNFKITVGANTYTFSLVTSGANPDAGTFSTLDGIVAAINTKSDLTARIVNDRLHVSAKKPELDNLVITDTGGSGGITNSIFGAATITENAAGNRFNSLEGLARLVNASEGMSATITNGQAPGSSISINAKDPTTSVTFNDGQAPARSLLYEFNVTTALATTTTGVINPSYDPAGVTGKNMASGNIVPQFTRSIRLFDPLGQGHDFRVAFIKSSSNTWQVEFYAANPTEISTTKPNGQIATGTVTFNGDGTLRSVSSTLTSAINVVWTNLAAPNTVALNFGTAGPIRGTPGATTVGLADGMSQFASPYSVNFFNQNGSGAGLLNNVSIDKDGFVIANYNNGESRKVYKLPLADFPNPNGLAERSGNAYARSDGSGEFNLKEAGTSGVGTFASGAVEGSSTDIATELTSMIVAQRAYQANTKVITTASSLLEELNQISR